jgi:hypothetical protein
VLSENTGPPSGWSARPGVARLLRGLVFVLPFGASVVFVWLVSRAVTAPDGTLGFVIWWLALSAGGSIVMLLVDRLARRLLPLAALLQLSLVFPDQAPSRFKAALEAGRVSRLEDRLELTRRASQAGSASESAELLLTLVAALSAHDRITRGHSERVRGYAVMIGRELGLSEAEIDQLNWAALLHDVGKLEIPSEILNSSRQPSEAEWRQLRRHPLYGEQLVAPMREWLGEWADAVGYHHERWDGLGYPRRVAGEAIPLSGRIVAVADVFDVITSARSYKAAGTPIAGREEIARCAGTQFDPRMVRAFLNVSLGRMRMVMGPLSWLAHLPIIGRLPVASMANTVWGALGVVVATTATGLAGTHAPVADSVARTPAVQQHRAAAPAARTHSQRRRPQAAKRERTAESPATEPVALQEAPATDSVQPGPAPDRDPDPAVAPSDPVVPALPDVAPGALPPLTPEPAGTPAPAAPAPVASEPAAVPAPIPPPVPVVLAPVAPVPNHAPSFTAGGDQSVLEDAGPRTIAGWASAISPGPFEGAQIVSFTVTSDAPSLFSVQPEISSDGTLSYTPAPDAHGSATVTVQAVDDGGMTSGGTNTSAEQTFIIAITPVNDQPEFVAGADQAVLEDAGPRVIPGWATAISAGPADEADQAISFLVGSSDPSLFSVQPVVSAAGTLTYTPADDAHGTATVVVTAVDDGGTGDGGVTTSAPQTVTITVAPVNDAPSFTAGSDPSVLESSGPSTIAGWASAITAGPADESGQSVAFLVTNDNAGLFAAAPALSPSGTLTFTPAAGAHGTATITVRAVDDGGTADGGADTSAPQSFTITVLAPNHAPSFTAGADPTVLEDSGAATLSGWASAISPGPAYESGQNVSFLLASTNMGLFAGQPAVAPSGTLSFTPSADADANGTATVTVRAVDDGGTADGGVDTSAPQTVTVTVTPVNDAPRFTAGGNQGVLITSSQQTIAGWASGIAAGPADESGQAVAFLVTNDNPGLFNSQPQVLPDGTLVYRPAIALGSATVTVRAVDNGGTANGGVDTSPPQTFTITVIF